MFFAQVGILISFRFLLGLTPTRAGKSEVLGKVFFRFLRFARFIGIYSAIHYSAKRGIAIACRLSVNLSVRL